MGRDRSVTAYIPYPLNRPTSHLSPPISVTLSVLHEHVDWISFAAQRWRRNKSPVDSQGYARTANSRVPTVQNAMSVLNQVGRTWWVTANPTATCVISEEETVSCNVVNSLKNSPTNEKRNIADIVAKSIQACPSATS